MLQDRAMIANLTIRAWSGQKFDKKVAEEVDKQHNAKNAGKYTKWIIDKAELDPLIRHSAKMREVHTEMTLPWGDNGDRLLPSRMYMKYTDTMRALRAEREGLARDFAQRYPVLVVSNAARLGSMYNPADYPSSAHIESRFGVELSFLPVPDANDFRVDVGNDAVAEIRASIDKNVAERQTAAVADCWERMAEVTDRIVERLSDPKAIFRDSLFENAAFVAEIVPDLNLTDDPTLTEAAGVLKKIANHTPDRVRHSPLLRKDVCDQAIDLLQFIKAHRG